MWQEQLYEEEYQQRKKLDEMYSKQPKEARRDGEVDKLLAQIAGDINLLVIARQKEVNGTSE